MVQHFYLRQQHRNNHFCSNWWFHVKRNPFMVISREYTRPWKEGGMMKNGYTWVSEREIDGDEVVLAHHWTWARRLFNVAESNLWRQRRRELSYEIYKLKKNPTHKVPFTLAFTNKTFVYLTLTEAEIYALHIDSHAF